MTETIVNEELEKDESGGEEALDKNTEAKEVEKAAEAAKAAEAEKDAADKEKDKGEDGEADKKADVPETYKDFTLPEGIVVDEELMGQFTPLAKELGLTQDQAQKLVDLQTQELAKSAEKQTSAWSDLNDKWVEEAKADKEYGGAKFSENIAVAKRALDKFGTPELREALDLTGAGNHPEFLRFMFRVGKTLKEDSVHSGKANKPAKDAASILFPNQN